MAIRISHNMRCKNKLCDFEGITESVSCHGMSSSPSLVCPKCGFKDLTEYHPNLDNIFEKVESEEQ